ncbi:MAG TPA: hypothetical protein DCL44_06015 [Elusimicrobia bacterium]|nr:hypothetical protein [Elusimicrobiota bacterium]
MKLHFYLLRDSISSIDDAISRSALEGYGEPIEPSRALPFKAKAFVRICPYCDAPESIRFISSAFSVECEKYKKTNVSCIVFIEVDGRVFVLPFNARGAIAHENLEPGFGLKVVANSIDSWQLKAVDSMKIDNNVIQRRTQLSKNSDMDDFELDTSVNWIQAITGKTADCAFGGTLESAPGKTRLKTLQGKDALAFTFSEEFERVGDQCRFLLARFREDKYKDKFKFIDEIQFLPCKDPVIAALEEDLRARLISFDTDRVHVVYPDLADEVSADKFKISSGHDYVFVEYLSIAQIADFMERAGLDDFETVKITACDAQDQPVSGKYTLKELLVVEIEREGTVYVLANNAWCRINSQYLAELNAAVDKISDLTEELALPSMLKKQSANAYARKYEAPDAYYERVARKLDALKLDKPRFHLPNGQKVEITDLLTKDSRFICVKKMNDSATLSHLFSQGSVASFLLEVNEAYRSAVLRLATGCWPGFKLKDKPCFVYAIATEKPGPLSRTLFFFSKITLLLHEREIASHGHTAALCKIGIKPVDDLPGEK